MAINQKIAVSIPSLVLKGSKKPCSIITENATNVVTLRTSRLIQERSFIPTIANDYELFNLLESDLTSYKNYYEEIRYLFIESLGSNFNEIYLKEPINDLISGNYDGIFLTFGRVDFQIALEDVNPQGGIL